MKNWFQKYSRFDSAEFVSMGISWSIKLLIAIVLLIIGFWLINRLLKVTVNKLHVREFDDTYKKFTRNLLNFGLKTVLIIAILNFAGIRTTSFIALLGAAGLAVGLALQGTLTNFAGGVLILLFKPFKVGDVVEAQGKKGVVKEVQIFTTLIQTIDNVMVIIPNSMLSNGVIENHSYIKRQEEEEADGGSLRRMSRQKRSGTENINVRPTGY